MNKLFLVLLFSLSLPVSVTSGTDHDHERPEFFSNYYVPNIEELGPDEMRVTALGTGFPDPRKAQVASSWFVELGNGEKFLFDVGRGSQNNYAMLQASYRDADKVFLSHLHVDHAGDLATLWIVGWTSGRYDRPLRVWGPSGKDSTLGTRHFLEMLQQTWKWDTTSRHGKIPAAGVEIKINEFDTAPEIREGIRKNYSGPLTMARDGMVFNITKNDINVRLLLGPEHAWPEIKNSEKFGKAKRGKNTPMSDWLIRSMLFPPKMDQKRGQGQL